MNIYNFIFCYFYIFWNKRNNDGRFSGILHVLLALLLHLLLIVQVIELIFDYNISTHFPNTGSNGSNKALYTIMSIPLFILLSYYYNRDRQKNLLKRYNKINKNSKSINLLKILVLIVLPIILNIVLINLNN